MPGYMPTDPAQRSWLRSGFPEVTALNAPILPGPARRCPRSSEGAAENGLYTDRCFTEATESFAKANRRPGVCT